MTKITTFTRFTAFILAAILLTSCSLRVATPSENGGLGRDDTFDSETGDPTGSDTGSESDTDTGSSTETDPPKNTDTDSSNNTDSGSGTETDPPEKNPTSVGLTGKVNWELVDGKYVYTYPEIDRTVTLDFSDIAHLYGTYFDDQGEGYDWYPGKVVRDLATGVVTYVWDRYKSTLNWLNQYGGIYRGDETQKVVYLTFDCGYEHGTTTLLLDILKEKNVPATFFVTGWYVKNNKDLLERMINEGHLIGNHTEGHANMTTVTAEEFVRQLLDLETLLKQTVPGAPDMFYFRPPSGTSNPWLLAMCDKLGYKTVMWSWTYKDYDTNNQPPVAESLEAAKKGLHNGAVYLLHAESTTNVAMLGDLIDYIRSEGYEILPICNIK